MTRERAVFQTKPKQTGPKHCDKKSVQFVNGVDSFKYGEHIIQSIVLKFCYKKVLLDLFNFLLQICNNVVMNNDR